MMSRFAVPVMVSTALHALVFWLGRSTPDRTPPPPTANSLRTVITQVVPMPPPDPEDTPPPPDRSENTPRGSREVAGPALPDFIKEVSDTEIPFTPPPRPAGPQISDHIPDYPWIGDPNSKEAFNPGTTSIINSAWLDRTPRTRSQTRPDYPAEARKLGLSGQVLVEFVVDESGRVLHPRVVRSTDDRFDAAALRAVERWRFEPGKKDGKVVRFRMAVPFEFSINES